MKLTIGTKLITGFMGLVILMLAISVVAYYNLQKVAESADRILYDEVPVSDASMEAIIAAITSRDLAGEYLLETNIKKLDAIENEYNEALTDFDMYINAVIFGSESEEFKTVENGAIHDMWEKDSLEGNTVIKKGNDEVVKFAKEADEFHKKFNENVIEMMKHHRNALMAQQVELNSDEIEAREHMEELDAWAAKSHEKMDEVEKAAGKSMELAMQEGDKSVTQANFLIILISTFSIIIGLLIGILLSRSISNPLVKIVKSAKAISLGNFNSEKIKVRSKDEIGILAQSFNIMTESLKAKADVLEKFAEGDFTAEIKIASEEDGVGKSLIKVADALNDSLSQVNSSVSQVASGSNQVAQASQSLSQGATEQASSLEEITSSITEISSQAKQNAENAFQASGLSKKAMENAENGNNQMKELVVAMGDINKSADEIKRIVKVIDDIAFQTNLLALNANVEAARAGKYGKGFAVVAEEVRNLASRSAESVQETTTMVEQAINNIQSGNQLVDTTSKQLEEIVEGASKAADLVEEIANASKEQTQGLEQINQGLGQIDQVTQSNTANAEQSASAAEELASQAQQLKAIVAKFKLANKKAGDMYDRDKISDNLIRKIREEIVKTHEDTVKSKSHLDKLHELNNSKKTKKQQTQITHIDHENIKDVDIKAQTPVIDPKRIIKLDDQDFGDF